MYTRRSHQETENLFQNMLRSNDYPESKYLYYLGERALSVVMDDLFAELDVTLIANTYTRMTSSDALRLSVAAASHLKAPITWNHLLDLHSQS